jgi:hypothetical protein
MAGGRVLKGAEEPTRFLLVLALAEDGHPPLLLDAPTANVVFGLQAPHRFDLTPPATSYSPACSSPSLSAQDLALRVTVPLRLHQHEMLPPVGDEALRHNPEKSVVPAHAGTPMGAQRDGELLPQEHVLQPQRTVAAEHGTQGTNEERHPIHHCAMLAHGADRHTDGVLALYTSCRPFREVGAEGTVMAGPWRGGVSPGRLVPG